MEGKMDEIKDKYYRKACNEFGIDCSDFSLFVFKSLWEPKVECLGNGDFSLVYEGIKSAFAFNMNNSELLKENLRLFKIDQKNKDEEFDDFIFDREPVLDDEQDDYDLQFGPSIKRRR